MLLQKYKKKGKKYGVSLYRSKSKHQRQISNNYQHVSLCISDNLSLPSLPLIILFPRTLTPETELVAFLLPPLDSLPSPAPIMDVGEEEERQEEGFNTKLITPFPHYLHHHHYVHSTTLPSTQGERD